MIAMTKSHQLDTDPIRSLFFKYYFPALISILSVTVHQIINGVILAYAVGKEGVAAIGLFAPILTVFIAFGLSLMIGGGILIAKNIGAQNYDRVQQIFQFTTTMVLLIGGIVAFSAPFITRPLANFLAGTENTAVVSNTSAYMFWGFIWLPFFLVRMLWGNFLSNAKNPRISRNATLIAVALNIILDVLLVIVIPLGVAGASIATGISVVISLFYLFFFIRNAKGHFSFKNFEFTLMLKDWRELISFGIPSLVSEISFAIGLLLINKNLLPYGSLAISAFGLVNYLSFIFPRLFTASMVAMLPIISFNIGARLPARALEIFKFSILFTLYLGIVVFVIGLMFPLFLVNIFSGEESEEFKELAQNAITLYFALFIAAGPNYILSAYFQSIGKSALSISINLLKGAGFVVGFLFLFEYLKTGLNGIWLIRAFSEMATLLLIGFYTLYKRENYYAAEIILKSNKTETMPKTL